MLYWTGRRIPALGLGAGPIADSDPCGAGERHQIHSHLAPHLSSSASPSQSVLSLQVCHSLTHNTARPGGDHPILAPPPPLPPHSSQLRRLIYRLATATASHRRITSGARRPDRAKYRKRSSSPFSNNLHSPLTPSQSDTRT